MKSILRLTVLLFLLPSCMPLAGLQTGRSLGKGNGIITPYLQSGNIYLPKDDTEKSISFVSTAGAQFSTGITNRLDLGGKVDISSFAAFQMKYQVLGNQTSTFAASVGAEVGLMLVPLLAGGVFYYASVPVFLSYHPKENLSFHLMPLYSFGQRYVAKNTNGSQGYKYALAQSGVSYGVSIGKKNKLAFEVGNYGTRIEQPTRVAIGYTFFFDK